MQITMRNEGENSEPEVFTILIMLRSISSVALKSAITPLLSGRMVLIPGFVRSCICCAFLPTAFNEPVWASTATIDGSSTTT